RARGYLMRCLGVIRIAAFLVPLAWAGATWGAAEPQASPAQPRAGITVWDTGRPVAGALESAALAGRNDWTAVPMGKTAGSVQAEPGTGAGKLRIECPGRFAVLPDFFADDLTIDATRLPLDAVDLPSENFVLHLTGEGDAIVMGVFENRRQDVRVTLSGQGD